MRCESHRKYEYNKKHTNFPTVRCGIVDRIGMEMIAFTAFRTMTWLVAQMVNLTMLV